jgi:hypothetical protein
VANRGVRLYTQNLSRRVSTRQRCEAYFAATRGTNAETTLHGPRPEWAHATMHSNRLERADATLHGTRPEWAHATVHGIRPERAHATVHGIRPEWAETTLAGVREPPVSVTSRSEKAGKADTNIKGLRFKNALQRCSQKETLRRRQPSISFSMGRQKGPPALGNGS